MNKGYKQLVAEATAVIETIPAAEAIRRLHDGSVVFIDLREPAELQRDGIIPGALNAVRGMLEFYADPASPYHQDVFQSDQTKLLYCASGARSALGAQRLQEMGLTGIAHLGGGLKAWKDAGGPLQAAAAGSAVPFRAAYTGTIAVDGNGAASFSGTGQAAQLGRLTSQGHIVFTNAPVIRAGDIPHDDFETLTFTSGDSFTIVSHDIACLIGTKQYDCSGNWEVMPESGTGRMTGVTGHGTFKGHSDYEQGVFDVELAGTITAP